MNVEDLENDDVNITEKEIERDEELDSILSENDNIYQVVIKCNLIGRGYSNDNIVEKLVSYLFKIIHDSVSYKVSTKIISILSNIPQEFSYQLVNKEVINHIFDYCNNTKNNTDTRYFETENIYNLLKVIHGLSPWLFKKLRDPDGNNALLYLIKHYDLEEYEKEFEEYVKANNPSYDGDGIILSIFKNNGLQKMLMNFLIKDALVDPTVENNYGESFADFVDFAEDMYTQAKKKD